MHFFKIYKYVNNSIFLKSVGKFVNK